MKVAEAMKLNREIMAIETAEQITEVHVICDWDEQACERKNMAPVPDMYWVLENCERGTDGSCLPVVYGKCEICQVTSEHCWMPWQED